ncbi:MAG: DUF3127 domain-containing protein [Fuerstiella sp.]
MNRIDGRFLSLSPCVAEVMRVGLRLINLRFRIVSPGHIRPSISPFSATDTIMSTGKVEGKVHFIEETKTYGQKGFRKRLVVLEQDNGRFTNYLPMEFIQDSCDDANSLNVGDEVEVMYRLNGRKWQKDPSSEVKYFLSAEATGFAVKGAAPPADAGAAPFSDGDAPFGETFSSDDEAPF